MFGVAAVIVLFDFCFVALCGLQRLCLALEVQVKVQYSDAAGSFLHTSSAKQVSVVLRHGHRPGTAEIDIDLPKAVSAHFCSHIHHVSSRLERWNS